VTGLVEGDQTGEISGTAGRHPCHSACFGVDEIDTQQQREKRADSELLSVRHVAFMLRPVISNTFGPLKTQWNLLQHMLHENRGRDLAKSLILLVPRKGFEPPTHALRMRCSTS
jgi:hypothetical protein